MCIRDSIDYKEVFALHTAKEADITIIYRHGTSPDTDKNVVYTVDPVSYTHLDVYKRQVFSIIEDNHIHHINNKQNLSGAEIGGIKMHAAIDVIFRRNHIHHLSLIHICL